MRVAIMQPYFLPYLGYYQLISAADVFVIYDRIQYSKKGWINRNRMLRNGAPVTFSIPLQKASDYLDVVERQISVGHDRKKLLNQIEGAYRKAPCFADVMPVIEEIILNPEDNLFGHIQNALQVSCAYLGITTPIRVSSEIEGGASELRNQERVIDICKHLDAKAYVNPPGGRDLYQAEAFLAHDLQLRFLEPHLAEYAQFGAPFQAGLSILDVMMFNTKSCIQDVLLKDYEIAA